MDEALKPKVVSRRAAIAVATSLVLAPAAVLAQDEPKYKPAKLPTGIPDFKLKKLQLDPVLVRDFVIAAHFSLEKVQGMLNDEPGLLNASFEWGNGDYERAIEGAGHTGHRDIALYLIGKGARVNLFCSAMLGDLDVVKAMITAHPEMKDSKGPHGISLMFHAQIGKDPAKPVVEYLQGLGLQLEQMK